MFMIRTFSTYRYSFGWFALCCYLFLLIIASTHYHKYSFSTKGEISLTKFIHNSDPYLDEFKFCKIIQIYKSQLNSKLSSTDITGTIDPENFTIDIREYNAFESFKGLHFSLRSPPLS